MKFAKKLTTKQFIFANLLILFTGLVFLGGLYYMINIQYQPPENPFLIGPITTPPKTFRLDLDQPEDNSLVFQQTITISGQTAASSNILIHSDNDDYVTESKTDGSFSTKWKLDEGANKLTITVFDPSGDSKSVERTIYYSKEKI